MAEQRAYAAKRRIHGRETADAYLEELEAQMAGEAERRGEEDGAGKEPGAGRRGVDELLRG